MDLKQIIEHGQSFDEHLLELYEKAFLLSYQEFVSGTDTANPSRKIASSQKLMKRLKEIKETDQDFRYIHFENQTDPRESFSYPGEKLIQLWRAANLVDTCSSLSSSYYVTELSENEIKELRMKYSA